MRAEVFLEQVRLQFIQHPRDGAVKDEAALLILKVGIHALHTVHLQQLKEIVVLDNGELDDLAHPVQDVTPGQGLQKGFVEQDHFRRVKGSQPILVPVEIDAGLDADRSVHVSHQGGRNFDVRHTAAVTASHESNHIGQYTAADGDDRFVAAID